jgi:prepilin-type N-terminal cleavage/methylation domain-containing protein
MSPFAHEGTAWKVMDVKFPTARCQGVTITELLVVVIILGILAAVAAPGLRSADPAKLDLAATQIAEAIRFARSEAMRTGSVHGVLVDAAQDSVLVEKTDLTQQPVVTEAILYHPLTRQSYVFDLDDRAATSAIDIPAPDPFDYFGLGRRSRVLFDANGVPVFMRPIAGETYHLTDGQVILSDGVGQRIVRVDSYTGRVSIQ